MRAVIFLLNVCNSLCTFVFLTGISMQRCKSITAAEENLSVKLAVALGEQEG